MQPIMYSRGSRRKSLSFPSFLNLAYRILYSETRSRTKQEH